MIVPETSCATFDVANGETRGFGVADMCARMCARAANFRVITRILPLMSIAYGSEGWGFESLQARTVLRQ
ncbi:hypothetical protein GCM10023087_03720 [Microbacterium rhizosphaerae]